MGVRVAVGCGIVTLFIDGVTVAGRLLHIEVLTRLGADYVAIAPSSSLGFLLLSAALLLLQPSPQKRSSGFVIVATAIGAFLVSLATISSYLLPQMEETLRWINAMSPLTAVGICVASVAVLLLHVEGSHTGSKKQVAASFALFVFSAGFLTALGYLYGTPVLYGGTTKPVALPSSLMLLFYGTGLAASAGTEILPFRLFYGPSVQARLMRSFLPTVLLLLLLAGWLQTGVMFHLLENHAVASTLVTILTVIALSIVTGRLAGSIGGDIDRNILQRKRAEDELQRSNLALKTLSKCNEALVHAESEDALLKDVCRIIVEDGRYRLAWVGVAENDPQKSVRPLAYAGFEQGYLEKAQITWADTARGRGPTGTAIRSGQITMCRNILSDPAFEPWREDAIKRGYSSSLVLPLKMGKESLGALNIYAVEPEAFDEKETGLLKEMAEDLSYGITSLRNRLERQRAEEEVRRYRDHLEELVKERTTQLEYANKELEAFAYSVSHDLRAPLRGMDGFSQALIEDYGEKFDDTGKDYLRRVRAAAARMSDLIDDLLELSRVGRSEMHVQSVNLSSLVEEIAAELKRTDPERTVHFVIEKGIQATADPRLLKIVLENLVGNAWKFTGKSAHASIEFGKMQIEGRNTCFIRDNGVGFDMQYAKKLFGAFQRLHTTSEFPGTGIGLATVQRIVHRHGGRVWATSAINNGATFYFTLSEGTRP